VGPLDKVRDRYTNDPAFHAFVDMTRAMIERLELSPSEVREAAMFACYMVEATRPIEPIAIGESLEGWLARRTR
jgi:hypothetical protein